MTLKETRKNKLLQEKPEKVWVLSPEKLIALRESRGWSHRQLAAIAGVNYGTIWKAEHGENIRIDIFGRIAAALKISKLSELCDLQTPPEIPVRHSERKTGTLPPKPAGQTGGL